MFGWSYSTMCNCRGTHEAGCYVPWDAGTFRYAHGRLRKKAIHPMRRCRAGHFSVPCPAKPLETLKARNTTVHAGMHIKDSKMKHDAHKVFDNTNINSSLNAHEFSADLMRETLKVCIAHSVWLERFILIILISWGPRLKSQDLHLTNFFHSLQ